MPRPWRIGILLIGGALAVSLLWGMGQMQARRAAENQLANRYQQAFFDALGHVENVEVLLSKGIASSAPEQIARVFSDLSREASAAQANMTQLPLEQGALMRTSRFLTQVGDFAYVMTRKAAEGTPPDGESVDLMRRMQQEAALLSAALHQIHEDSRTGPMRWEEMRKRSNVRIQEDSKAIEETGFTRLESHFQQIPVIQYDGPFSDHLLQRNPKGLTGDDVSQARAEEIALAFVGQRQAEGARARMVRRVEGGDIPAYGIAIEPAERERPPIAIDVSVKGGHVVWMIDPRQVPRAELSTEEAVKRAQEFLNGRGFSSVVPTYISRSENRVVVPFVPLEDGVRMYPDLLKVTVALDDGSIVGYEALGYLMSHHERTLDSPELSADEAKERVASRLQVVGEPRLAVIPLPTLDEVLTWEVQATEGDETFLVYLNAQTGKEEQILRVVHTEDGELTM